MSQPESPRKWRNLYLKVPQTGTHTLKGIQNNNGIRQHPEKRVHEELESLSFRMLCKIPTTGGSSPHPSGFLKCFLSLAHTSKYICVVVLINVFPKAHMMSHTYNPGSECHTYLGCLGRPSILFKVLFFSFLLVL